MEFFQIYRPITGTPFQCDDSYREYEPCEALKPYVRCFWGSRRPYREEKGEYGVSTVIPDTCMDIIFDVNFTDNYINSSFCGINDSSFHSDRKVEKSCVVSTFAVRFYAWSAVFFAEESMSGVKNGFFDADSHFSSIRKEIAPLLFDVTSINERIPLVETVLMRHLKPERKDRIVTEAVGEMLRHRGNLRMDKLAGEIHVSNRQIERVFKENMGVSPKTLSSLIRYQYVWREALFQRNFQMQDAVGKFGYTDQSHLLREFKKYHSLSIRKALENARKDVGFLQ